MTLDSVYLSERIAIGDDGAQQREQHVRYDAVGPWQRRKDLDYWHCLHDERWQRAAPEA